MPIFIDENEPEAARVGNDGVVIIKSSKSSTAKADQLAKVLNATNTIKPIHAIWISPKSSLESLYFIRELKNLRHLRIESDRIIDCAAIPYLTNLKSIYFNTRSDKFVDSLSGISLDKIHLAVECKKNEYALGEVCKYKNVSSIRFINWPFDDLSLTRPLNARAVRFDRGEFSRADGLVCGFVSFMGCRKLKSLERLHAYRILFADCMNIQYKYVKDVVGLLSIEVYSCNKIMDVELIKKSSSLLRVEINDTEYVGILCNKIKNTFIKYVKICGKNITYEIDRICESELSIRREGNRCIVIKIGGGIDVEHEIEGVILDDWQNSFSKLRSAEKSTL